MTEITLNRPNWLGSAVGLVLKTIEVPSDFATTVTEDNRTIVKSGQYFSTPYKGLLFGDIDITDGDQEGSLMIRGSYIDGNLPATVAAYATDFKAQGLFAITEGSVTRPDYGTDALTVLTATTGTATLGAIEIVRNDNAVGYSVYSVADTVYTYVGKVTQPSLGNATYTVTEIGTYVVICLGDNITYSDSVYSAEITVSALE